MYALPYLCVFSLKPLNRFTDFDETWCMKHGAVRGRPNAVFVEFCAVRKSLRGGKPASAILGP
jgi:hypothetical protein